jgi:hypothetical protein
VGLVYPAEFSPSRVAGYWLPAPPLPFLRRGAGLRGVSRFDYPLLRGATGPLLGFDPPSGCQVGRSGRPVSRPTPPMRFTPLRRRRPQIRFTRVCLTRHLPASGFGYPLAGLLPASASRSEDRVPPLGFTLQGLSLEPAAPVSRPLPSCRFPALPAFSSEDEKVGRSAATSGPYSGQRSGASGGSNPPSEPRPSWATSPSGVPAPP